MADKKPEPQTAPATSPKKAPLFSVGYLGSTSGTPVLCKGRQFTTDAEGKPTKDLEPVTQNHVVDLTDPRNLAAVADALNTSSSPLAVQSTAQAQAASLRAAQESQSAARKRAAAKAGKG